MRRRTNSQQSIRIRSLENDCSRLLAENLSLREQVLQLQNALESHSSRPSFENIDAVKSKLEAKMAELGGLVAELGNMKKEERPRCRSQLAATRRSPDERQWRSGLGLQEVENQMMPTIVEGKPFPRRTMGYVELTTRFMVDGMLTKAARMNYEKYWKTRTVSHRTLGRRRYRASTTTRSPYLSIPVSQRKKCVLSLQMKESLRCQSISKRVGSGERVDRS